MADETSAKLKAEEPQIYMQAAMQACFHQLLDLMIGKGVVSAQEALDAFTNLSHEIQSQPGAKYGVAVIENVCREISERYGVARPSA